MLLLMSLSGLLMFGPLADAPARHVLKPPNHAGVYVVAHRGAHEGIPENTLAAYQKAIDLGADFIEIDTRATKDGNIVSVHNSTVDAYTKDAKGPVKDFTLAQLKALDIGSSVNPKWAKERIPTFEEILALAKGKIGVYLDLKEAPVPQLVAQVKKYGMEHDVIWYASISEQNQIRKLCPECVPMPDPGVEKNLAELLSTFHPTVVASEWKFYSEDYVKKCHAAKALVIVDESDPSCWDAALAWGSDGIQTNHPAGLIEYLNKIPVKTP